MGVGNHASLLNGRVHKGHAAACERGNRVGGALLKTAGIQRIGNATRDSRLLHACASTRANGNALRRIGRQHVYARLPRHNPGVFGSSRKRLLKRDGFVGKAELHRFARAAIGNGKDNCTTIVYHFLDTREKTRIRTGNSRLLDLELSRHGTAGANERNVVQTLLMAKVELLSAYVESIELRHARFAGAALQVLIGSNAIVKKRAGLGKDHKGVIAHMGKRTHRRLVEQRQETLELGCDDARLDHLQEGGELGVVFRRCVQRRGNAVNGVVGKRKLAAGINLDRIGIADRLACRCDHMTNTIEFIAKELHAHRRRSLRGVDVHGIAVHVKITRFGCCIGRCVAHGHKTRGHLFERNLVSHGKDRGLPVAALARGHAAQ